MLLYVYVPCRPMTKGSTRKLRETFERDGGSLSDMFQDRNNRRQFLQALGAVGAAGLAGCSSDQPDNGGDDGASEEPADD